MTIRFSTFLAILATAVLILSGTPAHGQTPNWKDEAKQVYARCNCDLPGSNLTAHSRKAGASPMDIVSATQAARQQLVTILTNTGRFASPGAPVQVRVDVPTIYNAPVRVYGRFQMRQVNGQYRVMDYFIPEGSLFGQYDKLQQTGFVLTNVFMPTSSGDQMLFDVVVTDLAGSVIDQQFTEVTFGGALDGIESYYHLDSVYIFAPGLVGFKGRFPTGAQILVKFGDARTNSSGVVYGQAIDGANLVVQYAMNPTTYPYAMDAVACFFQQCYNIPSGLVFNPTAIMPSPR